MKKFKIKDEVKSIKYKDQLGIITEIYDNWIDLKRKSDFITIDPDNESNEMDEIEKLINGDIRDSWLDAQEIPFTPEQLKESWYKVNLHFGGSIWSCESCLVSVNPKDN